MENIFMLITQRGIALWHIKTWEQNHQGTQNHIIFMKNKSHVF